MKKVWVFGSLNMDLSIECERMPEAGETLPGQNFLLNPGGKGGNQAVASSRSGTETYLIGEVGDDPFGKALLESLRESSVHTEYVRESSERATGIALILRSEGDNRIILGAGANHGPTSREVLEVLQREAKEGDLFVTPFENEPQAVIESLQGAKDLGLFTIFNPAPARAMPDTLFSSVDLFVINQTECEFYTGIYPETGEEARRAFSIFREKGGNDLIITLGERGSIVFSKTVFDVSAYRVKVLDTTAAGDTFIGALAATLARGDDLTQAVHYATAASALAVMGVGAQASIPGRKEVEQWIKEMKK